MKKVLCLMLLVLCVGSVSCGTLGPKLVGPGDKIGEMTVEDHSENQTYPSMVTYCGDWLYLGIEPGSKTSDCDVPFIPGIAIGFSWEAKDANLFESSLSAVEWEMYVDDYRINLDDFKLRTYEPNLGGWEMDLVNLSPGKHTMRLLWRTEKPMDDGFDIYPPGTYESIVNFTVAEK